MRKIPDDWQVTIDWWDVAGPSLGDILDPELERRGRTSWSTKVVHDVPSAYLSHPRRESIGWFLFAIVVISIVATIIIMMKA